MSEPEIDFFDVGDIVEFEECKHGHYPRWNLYVDNGGSGKWIKGKVCSIQEDVMTIEFPLGSPVVNYWDWPTDHYENACWNFPGYLRKAGSATANKKFRLVQKSEKGKAYFSLEKVS